MTDTIYQADLEAVKSFLLKLIESQAPQKSWDWLDRKHQELQKTDVQRKFFLAFSAVPRFFPKQSLKLDELQQEEATALRSGWSLNNWDLVQTVRTLILLMFPHQSEETYQGYLEKLFDTADMNEQMALYAALPLLPHPKSYVLRAAEGVRTNMTGVFDAIALQNPYPKTYFEDNAWNQVFLKAAFMSRPLYKIIGVEERANAELARIISDYAHERWAAGRVVSPELWRPASKFFNEGLKKDLERVFANEEPLQKEAAALLCSQSNHPEAQKMLEAYPELKTRIEAGEITWASIGWQWNESEI